MTSQAEHDDAWANAAHIPGAEGYVARWAEAAEAFRELHPPEVLRHGPGARRDVDLFRPKGATKGLVVFVHGGYWLRFGPRDWSHLAAGALAEGWAVALPGYDLCPAVRIAEITRQIAAAVDVAAEAVAGPVRLAGHSAGGHLVARMGDEGLPLACRGRVARIVPISPVADLAPLMLTSMNERLRIDAAEARAESPVHQPRPDVPVHVWVGADERPVFVAQAKALAEAWEAELTVEAGRHHFDVVEGLEGADSALLRAVLG
ncbi:alpha/beta hydrolase [Histidinibacterium lentulum]|uniref:Alpha/beta fold hydrolase n=1 Tax=Histidinibacterium lentulum TaxID=2480588 RepID=A0A3N2R188_9RHOB|nr:alpha/beta hydrolase [Histidinibacterium lentulum]ROU01046.1 alpha/beta fold hydrolase [Histidinibacterium lentulum]